MNKAEQKIKFMYQNYMNQTVNPDVVLNRSGKQYENLRVIKTDSHLWSCIQQRKSGVMTLESKIEGPQEKEVKEILKHINIKNAIRDILEAPLFGFQPIEIIWTYEGGKIIPKELLTQKQEYFTYDTEGVLKYYNEHNKPTDIPELKILNPRYEANNINPYGSSLLAKSYWLVQFKKNTIRNWVNFSELFGLPLYIAEHEHMGGKQLSDLEAKIEEAADGQVFVIPKDLNFRIESLKNNTSKEIYNGIISMCNTEISKAILAQTLTTEINIGSYAAANIHYKVRKEVIQCDIEIVEETINQLIAWTLAINGRDTTNETKFKIIYTNEDNMEIVNRDEKLVKMGVKLNKEYFKKQYNLTDDDFEYNDKTNQEEKKPLHE